MKWHTVNYLQKIRTTYRLTQVKSVTEVGFRQGWIRALAFFSYDSPVPPHLSPTSMCPFILMLTSYLVARGLHWHGGGASIISNNHKTKA